MADQRNCARQHQYHRHAIRSAKRVNQTLSHSPERTRSSARSWRRQELVATGADSDYSDVYDENSYETNVDYSYSKPVQSVCYGKYKKDAVRHAIDSDDAVLLHAIMQERKVNARQRQYPQKRYRLRKRRNRHTMLTHAIDREESDCAHIILNNIFHGYVYRTIIEHVCSNGRTALWCASRKGDLRLVKQLVQRGHANVNKCGVLIVAAQHGHKYIIHYLLRKGCDPNQQARNYNELALHAATRRNHLDIVKVLLQYGADPLLVDYKQRTALDYAIHKRYNHIAEILINHQHDRFPMARTGFTALMLADYCNNTPIKEMLIRILPEKQVVDELALVACHYIIDGNQKKRRTAYSYLERALSKRILTDNGSTRETLDELALIRDDDSKLRAFALMMSERVSAENGEKNHLMPLLRKQDNLYRWKKQYDRCLEIRMHAYELLLKNESKGRKNVKLRTEHLIGVLNALDKILKSENTIPMRHMGIVWSWMLDLGSYPSLHIPWRSSSKEIILEAQEKYRGRRMRSRRCTYYQDSPSPFHLHFPEQSSIRRRNKTSTEIVFKLLFVMLHMIDAKKVNEQEEHVLLSFVRRGVRSNTIEIDGYPLFTFFVSLIHSGWDDCTYSSITMPTLSIIRLLINARANVDELEPRTKSTPLHLIASSDDVDAAIATIRILLDANAHLDYVNYQGLRPEDVANNFEIKDYLRVNRQLSLKCQYLEGQKATPQRRISIGT
ncbi:unnamed protein product [Adineta ricciae]|uniref:Uncharacterized protein n=1 Tax=Adineta ricciae TaxID=249248 RepID=A0A814RCV8_ADIRI|nr:unnamed protein product [Adineta ricciae]